MYTHTHIHKSYLPTYLPTFESLLDKATEKLLLVKLRKL